MILLNAAHKWYAMFCTYHSVLYCSYWRLILSAWHPVRWRPQSRWNLYKLFFTICTTQLVAMHCYCPEYTYTVNGPYCIRLSMDEALHRTELQCTVHSILNCAELYCTFATHDKQDALWSWPLTRQPHVPEVPEWEVPSEGSQDVGHLGCTA